ncbi:hypothetical protein ACFL3S_09945 [Gemmatimonadota bacterium]
MPRGSRRRAGRPIPPEEPPPSHLAKSGHTFAFPTFEGRLSERGDARWKLSRRIVVYGGDESQSRSTGELVSWTDLPRLNLLPEIGPES